MRIYLFLADLILITHLLYLLFAVGGEILIIAGALLKVKWIRNISLRVVHLLSVILVAIESISGITCPLTIWEDQLRMLAGEQVNTELSFLGKIIQKIIYYDFPSWFFIALYTGFALIVVITWIIIPPRRKTEKKGPPPGIE